MKYARQWTQHARISFEVVTSGDAEIRIKFNEGGPLSYVGTSSLAVPQSQKTMNLVLNSWFPEEEFARAALHGFGHALGLRHIHLIAPSDIFWEPNQPYSYYQDTQNWSKKEVDVNVLNILAADPGPPPGPRRDSVMIYSIPASLTSNDLNIQGGHVLATTDIAVIGESFPSWNDLNAVESGVPGSSVESGTFKLQQIISPVASGVPNVANGLTSLDITTVGGLRFRSSIEKVTQSSIDINLGTWYKSTLYHTAISTFWATPSSSKHNFKTGKYRTEGRAINQRINFDKPLFRTRPRVFVGLTAFDVTNVLDLDVSVASIDQAGFVVNITSSGNIVFAEINWIAWPEDQPGVETGSFYGNNLVENKGANGEIAFDSTFDSQPKVHFALGGFNAAQSNFRLNLDAEVSKTSLSWSAKTWADSKLNRVRGNYLVFKV